MHPLPRARYCSRACQGEHFAAHRRNCKSIEKKRTFAEKNWADERGGPSHSTASALDEEFERGMSRLTLVVTVEFADLLVQVGHRESGSIASGGVYYREALKHYLMPKKLLGDEYHSSYAWIEDRILFLLVVLGGDESHTQAWCFETGSMRSMCYLPADLINTFEEDLHIPPDHGFEIGGFAVDDITFQAMLLLSQIRLMAAYRRSLEGLSVYKETLQRAATALGYTCTIDDITNHVSPYLMGEAHEGKVELEVLPDEIRTVVRSLRYHGKDAFLRHLRDSVPFKKEHVPNLFSAGVHAFGDGAAPPELWMLYRDCFFETPDLRNLLREFIDAEGL